MNLFFSISFYFRRIREGGGGISKNRYLINSLVDVTHRRPTSDWCSLEGRGKLRNNGTFLRPSRIERPLRNRSIESITAANPIKRKWVGSHCLPPPAREGKRIHRERDRGIREQYDQPRATPGRTLFIAQQFTTNKNRVHEYARAREKFRIERRTEIAVGIR